MCTPCLANTCDFSAEVRWNHAHVLKVIYGLMSRVDKISYGTATAVMRTSRVEIAAEEGALKIWKKKIMDDTIPFYSCTISVQEKTIVRRLSIKKLRSTSKRVNKRQNQVNRTGTVQNRFQVLEIWCTEFGDFQPGHVRLL